MANFNQPKLPISKNKIDYLMESIAFLMLIYTWVISINSYKDLPSVIPIHYDVFGKADNYGSKSNIWILPIITTIIVIGFYFLNKIPHKYNYIVKITEENAQRQYKMSTRLIRFLQLDISILFSYINYKEISGAKQLNSSLDWWFLPLLLSTIFVPTIYMIVSTSSMQSKKSKI